MGRFIKFTAHEANIPPAHVINVDQDDVGPAGLVASGKDRQAEGQ